jgi:hypothetical protein
VLAVHHYFKFLNFKTYNFTEKNVVDSIINAIGPQQESQHSKDNIEQVLIFFNNKIDIVKQVNRYEFYIALTLLKNADSVNWKPKKVLSIL